MYDHTFLKKMISNSHFLSLLLKKTGFRGLYVFAYYIVQNKKVEKILRFSQLHFTRQRRVGAIAWVPS